MNPIHQDDLQTIGNAHFTAHSRIGTALAHLQGDAYTTGVERGKELAKQAAIEAGTISPAHRQTIHLGQPGVTVEPCLMLGPADDEVACLLFTAPGTEVRLTWPTQTQALAVLAAATGEQAETPPAPAPVEQATHKKSLSVRQSIIDVLLSTAGQSEAVAAEAIMSIMRPPVERVEQEAVAEVITNVVGIEMAWIDPWNKPPVGTKLYTTPQPAAAPSRDVIRATLMAHGFTVKIGQNDLKPYVYEAVEALFARPAPAAQYVEGLVSEAEFLLARLSDMEQCLVDDDLCREYQGHVVPSAARLRMLLDAHQSGGAK